MWSVKVKHPEMDGLSVIIPTLNEVDFIGRLLDFLTEHSEQKSFEIIVVDGGSKDGTCDEVVKYANVRMIRSVLASRAIQMNLGAQKARYNVLYFVHADVVLPNSFYDDISHAVQCAPYGGFRYRFDSSRWILKINAAFTRFPMLWCRGGDQTLFITKEFFKRLEGFDEHYCVMEDFDMLRRGRKLSKYHIIPKNVIVSARKYRRNSYWKVQIANFKAFRMFNRGESPQRIRTYYKLALGLKDY